MPAAYHPKLIEVALPLDAINVASAKEKSIRSGHPSTLHLWWARRPLASCRAVLFSQLVDDPSGWPEEFPTEADQDRERERLFDLIRAMVPWEASGDPTVLADARREIARSAARSAIAGGDADPRHAEVLGNADDRTVSRYVAERLPPLRDPFAGGGSIPLEGQRLGLRAIATDLNPVAVLLNKVQVEIAGRFAGRAPVHPEARRQLHAWIGAMGLAEDLRHYGAWMKAQAQEKIGHMYPSVRLPNGAHATVIAWLWARTVPSPDPAARGAHVPLIASYWICKKPGKLAWIEPVVDRAAGTWRFEVRTGEPLDEEAVSAGTKAGRGDFLCLLTGSPIPAAYSREQGKKGRIGRRMVAIVAEGGRQRVYVPATPEHEAAALCGPPETQPTTDLPKQALGFRVQNYGYATHASLYTERQLTTLDTLAGLIQEARQRVLDNARAAGMKEGRSLADGGDDGAQAYADALAVLLSMAVSRRSDKWSSFSIWNTHRETIESLIRLSAVPMTWEFAEGNPFSGATGNFVDGVELTAKSLASLGVGPAGEAHQADARVRPGGEPAIFSTDPPYFDNVPYADLSDLFYVWLRRMLHPVLPGLMSTMLVPKAAELVADAARHKNKHEAEDYFLHGMQDVLGRVHDETVADIPVTIFYAFKQSQNEGAAVVSTGWETFLSALVDAGFVIVGTWPMRTEQTGGLRNVGRNSLATSVVLVCRRRPADARTVSRGEFRRLLRTDLPPALRHLQHGNIAPVDVAQAAIGPGIGIFSRHARVLEADGSSMTVRTALQLINEALDEFLSEAEGELDADTRFAVTWFESHGYETGLFGEAETLAKARNVSVAGVADAGILSAAAGKVRLHTRADLPTGWDPRTDSHLTVWEATQHLIKRLEEQGEAAAAELLGLLGPTAEQARALAYRLYTACERRKWAEEARAYNGLVVAWPELERLAAKAGPKPTPPSDPQADLFHNGDRG